MQLNAAQGRACQDQLTLTQRGRMYFLIGKKVMRIFFGSVLKICLEMTAWDAAARHVAAWNRMLHFCRLTKRKEKKAKLRDPRLSRCGGTRVTPGLR